MECDLFFFLAFDYFLFDLNFERSVLRRLEYVIRNAMQADIKLRDNGIKWYNLLFFVFSNYCACVLIRINVSIVEFSIAFCFTRKWLRPYIWCFMLLFAFSFLWIFLWISYVCTKNVHSKQRNVIEFKCVWKGNQEKYTLYRGQLKLFFSYFFCYRLLFLCLYFYLCEKEMILNTSWPKKIEWF